MKERTATGLSRTNAIERLRRRIRVARGEAAPDLVLKGGRIVNVFSGEIIAGDCALCDGSIAGIGAYNGPNEIDCRGCYLAPGLIDGHCHIESSLLAPRELARAVLPHGTTAVVADPHEIANVLGAEGIAYLLDTSAALPVDFFFLLPSCVPATHLETAGAALSAADLAAFLGRERILGLGEMMNYPGVLGADEAVLDKIALFRGAVKDGHAPLLSGRDLNAYIAAGLESDHESTGIEEAREKLRLGMHIMIREGTQAKNLRALLPLVSPFAARRFSLVTDDLHPDDLVRRGHLDRLVDLAVGEGLDPVVALGMASYTTALYFGFTNRGAVAPGYTADILILSSLQPLCIDTVLKNGRIAVTEGALAFPFPDRLPPERGRSPLRMDFPGKEALRIPRKGRMVRVIGLLSDQIVTEGLVVEAPGEGEYVTADPGRDLLKIAVVERHRGTGNIGLGLVRGFGLQRGAIASSVAHDSHNIICVGCDDGDMEGAVRAVAARGGGMAVVSDGVVRAEMPLPLAGLMSDQPLAVVHRQWQALQEATAALGCRLPQPFMALSFLALPVIPALKITDRGIVDVASFELVPLFVE